MKNPLLNITAGFLLSGSVIANPIADQLAGQRRDIEENKEGEKPVMRTRGIPKKPTIRTESQTIYTTRGVAEEMLRTRGVPTDVRIGDDAAVEDTLQSGGKLKVGVGKLDSSVIGKTGVGELPVHAGEEVVAIEIGVDPESRLEGQINFVKNQAIIKDDSSLAFLSDLVEALKDPRLKTQKFVIQGHASTDGDALPNLELSQKRADAIFLELRSRGVEPNRIFALGVGEQNARYEEDKPENLRAQDRRVILYRLEN